MRCRTRTITRGGAATAAFEVEPGLEGLVDGFDDLSQRLEEPDPVKEKAMLRGFATINYWADDLGAAKRWYAELLGVEPYFERQDPTDGPPTPSSASATTRTSWGSSTAGGRLPARRPSQAGRSCTGTSTTSRRRSRSCYRWVHASTSQSPGAATRGS